MRMFRGTKIRKIVELIFRPVMYGRLVVVNILLLLLLTSPAQAQAQAQDYDSVLVLHSVFEQRAWDREFDLAYVAAIRATDYSNVEFAFQGLGGDQSRTAASNSLLREHIENLIVEQGIDLIVTVLPGAVEFVLELGSTNDIPHVLVIPQLESISSENRNSSASIGIVRSTWRQSIHTTIEQILVLRPQTETIEVIAGNNATNHLYLDRLRQITPDFSGRVEFSYYTHYSPDTLEMYVVQLDESSTVLLLPFATYGPNQEYYGADYLPRLTESSAVPIFGILDSLLGTGIVGGNVATVDNYAKTAAEITVGLLSGEIGTEPVVLGETTNLFDWRQVQRWNLPLELLDTPYTLLFKPKTLWEEYPIVSFVVANLIFLLLVGLLIQFILLKRSRAAQLFVAASEKLTRASEARYRLLANNSIDVIWTWGTESNSLNYCSPAIESLTGFTPAEYLHKTLDEFMIPESVALCQNILDTEDFDPHVIEITLYKKQGGTVCCEIAAQQTASPPGVPSEWVGVTRDISQRKASEAERLALENQVRQAQKIESLGTLAGGIAHDFNNVLAVVTGITELLKVEMQGQKSASRLLDRLISASDKAKALVSQILTFSRQSKGQKETTNLSALVEDSLDILEAGISKQITIEKHIDTGVLNVEVDPSHMGQVIINLITNASEAIEGHDGCISITLSQCNFDQMKELLYGQLAIGDYARLQVKDNGSGIPEQNLDMIFDPFFTSKELGNGLGLSIVHGIVMDHLGGIDVHSVFGEGTLITVYLPLTEANMSTALEQDLVAESESTELDPMRILVVDDNLDLLDTVSSMLQHLGHSCVSCSEPKEALNLLQREHDNLDLVITDYSMPNISGIEILDHCNKHYPSLPVILSTGYSEEVRDQLDNDQAAIRILNKPYTFDELNQVLRQTQERYPLSLER